MKTHHFILILVVLLAAIQTTLWFGKGGVLQYWEDQNTLSFLKSENEKLTLRNDSLKAEIINLQNEADAVEERARENLGLIKKDETFYRIIEDNKKKRTEKDE